MRRDGLIALVLLGLLGPIPAHATVLCEGGWPRGPDRHAWRCTGPAWLVRRDAVGEPRTPSFTPPSKSEVLQPSVSASDTPTLTGWQRAGAYGLEFGGAVLGTAMAGAAFVGTGWAMSTWGRIPDEAQPGIFVVVSAATALVYNPVLTATGTFFGGKIVRQHGSFWRTLVGSVVGGATGTAAVYGYGSYWSSHHNYWGATQNATMLSCAIVPTLVGAVVVYNVWKGSESR